MMSKEIIDKLKLSGLTKREAHIYLALLQKKNFTASELASIVPIGRTKIYEVMPRLLSLGFCTEIHRDGKRIFTAIEPTSVLKKLLANYQAELNDIFLQKEKLLVNKINIISELENQLNSMYLENAAKSDDLNYITVFRDITQIRNKWVELQKQTKFELLAFNKAPYSIQHEKNAPHQAKMLKRKIMERGIYEYKSIDSKEELDNFIDVVELYAGLGEDCRIIKDLPMKLVVIDEKVTMLALDDPVSMTPTITTMVITHPSFAKAQKQVFESYWKISESLKDFKRKAYRSVNIKSL